MPSTIESIQTIIASIPPRILALRGSRTILDMRRVRGRWPGPRTASIRKQFNLKASPKDLPALIAELDIIIENELSARLSG